MVISVVISIHAKSRFPYLDTFLPDSVIIPIFAYLSLHSSTPTLPTIGLHFSLSIRFIPSHLKILLPPTYKPLRRIPKPAILCFSLCFILFVFHSFAQWVISRPFIVYSEGYINYVFSSRNLKIYSLSIPTYCVPNNNQKSVRCIWAEANV